jgi:uncharacterized protein (TIGR02466 family)|tara:strand:+ start:1795 stop:2355 length:561 start_codon:yes stop_codon:yes gene_type:complete
MLLQTIFCDSIFKTVLNNNNYKNYFIKKLNTCKQSSYKSNVGGFQSNSFYNIRKDILKDIFLNPAYKYTEKLNPKKQFKIELINYWINKNKTHDYNLMHSHDGFLSGIYYIKTPIDCGRLVFQNGNLTKMQYNYVNYFDNPNFFSTFISEVSEGEIYLFPSNLLHSVEPNRSNEERISVSFNLRIV